MGVMMTDPIEEALQEIPLGVLARELCVSGQAIRKWQRARRMPRTEWTGETQYSQAIEKLTDGAVTRERLLAPWPAVSEQAVAPLQRAA